MGRPKELSDAERAELMAQGLRPAEVWVPDWDSPAFRKQIEEDCRAINAADARSGESRRLSEEVDDLWNNPSE
ncbi:antitoxin MazE-like protein [Mangrovicella endophytica]|uniref:antitoxin MazE-like protein n=1 Tax=Mangrovicella endophytica TaxID=2066697 RepID=UPI000C9E5AA2|nr:antitoxin MazE-like protein [Mangrovicella endophytica]